MYCSFCGTSVPDNSIFCPNCGKKIQEIQTVPPPPPNISTSSLPQRNTYTTKQVSDLGYGLIGLITLINALVYPTLSTMSATRYWSMQQHTLYVGGYTLLSLIALGIILILFTKKNSSKIMAIVAISLTIILQIWYMYK